MEKLERLVIDQLRSRVLTDDNLEKLAKLVNDELQSTSSVLRERLDVIDALKKTDEDPRFLFYDDCQVARLLVWKLQAVEHVGWNTDSLTISFRVHDAGKRMIMLEPSII